MKMVVKTNAGYCSSKLNKVQQPLCNIVNKCFTCLGGYLMLSPDKLTI